MSIVFPIYSCENRSFMTTPGRPSPLFVLTQFSWKACAVPEYGDPIAEEDALAMDGPEAAEPVGIRGSVEYAEGGVVGIEKLGFLSSDSNMWVSRYEWGRRERSVCP